DPYLLEFEAEIQARREHQGRPAVVLDRTAFYAENGGQPWDTGSLSGVPVVAVIEEGGEVLHVLGAPLGADRVSGVVDGARRQDHRQQHHGQHLLSRAFVEVAGAATVSFHLGAEVSTIDLDREVGEAQVTAAEARANEVVWGARPVRVITMPREEATARGIVVPPEARGDIRVVEAEAFDVQPCGGTHPRNTAEVGVVLVVGTEKYKAGTRVRFVCGHRAVAAFRQSRSALDRLSTLFSAPLAGLPEAAARALAQTDALTRKVRDLQERALDGEARRLFAGTDSSPAVVVAVYDGWPPADLRTLALRLVALGPCVALLGSRGEKAYVTFAQAEGLGHDLPALLQEALRELGGKGGGRGNLVQGAGERPHALAPLLERLAAGLRPPA
ncbi:MAG TPA: alanyl-tRNA editing protein, partial [Vicinamibacteria bacterium]|nr:alanyl-tRNA editing protein [Vicinamibacteria bacterium]